MKENIELAKKTEGFFIILTNNISKASEELIEKIKFNQCLAPTHSRCCNNCYWCNLFNSSSYPYLFKISPEQGKQKISIEIIRSLEGYFYLKTPKEYKKYIIIENAQKLSIEAQNHLLKTLEEIPFATFFFFITNNISGILPTVLSRAQKVFFTFPSYFSSNINNESLQKLINFWNSTKKKDINLYEALKKEIFGDKKITYEEKRTLLKSYLETFADYVLQQSKQNPYLVIVAQEILEILKELKYNITLELFLLNFYLKLIEWKSLIL
jgi:DNA polymerase III delta prime subunit